MRRAACESSCEKTKGHNNGQSRGARAQTEHVPMTAAERPVAETSAAHEARATRRHTHDETKPRGSQDRTTHA